MTAPTPVTLEISKEYLSFSAAHFTIFDAQEREDLHGHNFHVACDVTAPVGADGLMFDYNVIKQRLKSLLDALDEKTLLPERSPHLTIDNSDGYVVACFADERMPFLPRDVLTLPLRNITVEELAPWLLDSLITDPEIRSLPLQSATLKVASGAGQWASATWQPT